MVRLHTSGAAHQAAEHFLTQQLKDRELWKKFVELFRTRPDGENNGWRGEYWGKMLRGGCLVYEYCQDEELYEILTDTVRDMLTCADADGSVSSYPRDKEFNAWDLWCRKYVILACEYYLDICKDEALKAQVITFISRCADYILLHIGDGEGQTRIVDATTKWRGLNSSSILEPIVKLYRMTGEQKYLDFATYIVNEGGAKGINVFRLAYENEIYPYQYGVSKAYEMISCFEGLLEYYYVTGEPWCKTAVINYAKALMDSEISVIGCSGITHELLDFTRARQTVRREGVSQETCVTVTWMKFCSRLLELTGDAVFADCMEQSFYNAYLGTLNPLRKSSAYLQRRRAEKGDLPEELDMVMPVDSYSPLLAGKRGMSVGGFQILSERSYYGCCACIASAGVGVFLKSMVTADEEGITVNFFENGTARACYDGVNVTVTQSTAYPADGRITLFVKTDVPKTFRLRVRAPGWTGRQDGYLVYEKQWSDDIITLAYDMPIRTQTPMQWDETVIYNPDQRTVCHDPDDDHYIALMRGPITLAADSRCGKEAGSVFAFVPEGTLCRENWIADGVPCLLKMRFTDKNGEDFYLVDYASAGKDWQTEIAAWLRTK